MLGKRNKKTSKKLDDHVRLQKCSVIVIFPIYDQFGDICKPNSRRIICKTYIFINSKLLSYENWKQNLKISNTAVTLLLWVKALFFTKKNADFLQKILTSAKKRRSCYQKAYFLKLNMFVYLRNKFQVSSVNLRSFRQGEQL